MRYGTTNYVVIKGRKENANIIITNIFDNKWKVIPAIAYRSDNPTDRVERLIADRFLKILGARKYKDARREEREWEYFKNYYNQKTGKNFSDNDKITAEVLIDFDGTEKAPVKKRTRKPVVVTTTATDESGTEVTETRTIDPEKVKTVAGNLINFFSEFGFEPNFRFVNTLANFCTNSRKAKDYVYNYFCLSGNEIADTVNDKMKSSEWDSIVTDLADLTPNKTINNRFKIYYGSQGTGKTTKALEEADNNCMVCHSAMLPADLMEDFKFVDGKADFQPSALQIAMITGKKIVLDEINLLPFESLRFLQSILDGKKEFEYKGKTVRIADGFQIIGTMNLVVNGVPYPLPEPLVDRCADIQNFKLTASSLVGAFI